jgi:hypothetical protein
MDKIHGRMINEALTMLCMMNLVIIMLFRSNSFNLTPRDEFQRIILRAAGDDNYPAAHRTSNTGSAHLRDAYIHNLAKAGDLES